MGIEPAAIEGESIGGDVGYHVRRDRGDIARTRERHVRHAIEENCGLKLRIALLAGDRDLLMTIALQSWSNAHHGKPRGGSRCRITVIETAIVESAVEWAGGLGGRISIFHDSVLARVNAGRRKGTHSADIADELNVLDFTAVIQIDQSGDARGIRESHRDGAKGVANCAAGRSAVAQGNGEGRRVAIRELMFISSANHSGGL